MMSTELDMNIRTLLKEICSLLGRLKQTYQEIEFPLHATRKGESKSISLYRLVITNDILILGSSYKTCRLRPAAAYVCSCSWPTPGLRPKGPDGLGAEGWQAGLGQNEPPSAG